MTGYQKFYSGWQSIVAVRNAFVHGRLARNHAPINTDLLPTNEVLSEIEENMLGAFAGIRNLAKERVDPKPPKLRLFPFNEITH